MTSRAVTPVGLNHLVLNVSDMEVSHAFWTEIIGLRLMGELRPSATFPEPLRMRFYSGDPGNGVMTHHDISLVEDKNLSPFDPSKSGEIGHIAFALPDRDGWLHQLAFLQERGIQFERRMEHGMSHSVYIRDPNGYCVELMYELPRELWEGDIDAALSHAIKLPTEGPEALQDRFEGLPIFAYRNGANAASI